MDLQKGASTSLKQSDWCMVELLFACMRLESMGVMLRGENRKKNSVQYQRPINLNLPAGLPKKKQNLTQD